MLRLVILLFATSLVARGEYTALFRCSKQRPARQLMRNVRGLFVAPSDRLGLAFDISKPMAKVLSSAEAAVALVPGGARIMMGGFGVCGVPENLIAALKQAGTNNLIVISNNAGVEGFGVGELLQHRQIRKLIATYVGENKECERQFLAGDLRVELIPQGTFAERIRAAGAGIAGFLTPTGYNTVVAEGKETRVIDNRGYLLEAPLAADFAFVRAWKGDREGNLVYRRTARNFNPVMATAARVTIAEVEELVDAGEIDPDHVATPAIFVKYIVKGENYQRRVEKLVTRGDE